MSDLAFRQQSHGFQDLPQSDKIRYVNASTVLNHSDRTIRVTAGGVTLTLPHPSQVPGAILSISGTSATLAGGFTGSSGAGGIVLYSDGLRFVAI